MLDLALLTSSLWTTLQPYVPILATKAAEEIGKKVPEAVGKVWGALKKKFDSKAAAQEALADLLKSPDDRDLQAAFRVQLKKLLEEDAGFAGDMHQLLKTASPTYAAHLEGDGAIAQGEGAKAVGAGGVLIEGNVTGSSVIAGDNNVSIVGDGNKVNKSQDDEEE